MSPHDATTSGLREKVARCLPAWYSLEVRDCRELSDGDLETLHQFANVMAAEDKSHFAQHMRTNHVVHLFFDRRDGQLAGFQAWRSEQLTNDRRILVGGKLRVRPASRGEGLHLLSGLRFYFDQRDTYPAVSFDRLAIANLFGFCTLVRNLAQYTIFGAREECRGVDLVRHDLLAKILAQSQYKLDPITGLIEVGIRVTETQLRLYPPAFYESDAAQVYLDRVPGALQSARQLALWFPFDRTNLSALCEGAMRRLLRAGR